MDIPVIKRGFAYVGERRVHFRAAGGGPPVVLLHQSPRSSAELVPLMQVLARHFRVIAPDTPGYGQSDPVAPSSSEPTIDAFADALVGRRGDVEAVRQTDTALVEHHCGDVLAETFERATEELVLPHDLHVGEQS